MADDNNNEESRVAREAKAAKCFRHGNKAMEAGNWDMASQMFRQCVNLVWENVVYRQLLRNSVKKKYDENGKGAGGLAKTKIMGLRGKIKKAKQKENWKEASLLAEDGLFLNPWDVQLNVDVAESAKALDDGEVARFAYYEAVRSAPKDKDLHVAFAALLEDREEFDDAIKIWERIAAIDPKDIEVTRKLSGLHAKKAEKKGGFGDAEKASDVAQNKNFGGETKSVAAQAADEETRRRHAIRKEPDKVEHYLALADILKRNKKFDEAYETMKQAVEISKGDPSVREQAEDAELLFMHYQVEEAKEKANKTEDPEDRKASAALANELRTRKIDVLTAREERHPQNLSIKMELAKLLMQLQEWSRSIPLLQKASQDPRQKTMALVLLGKCFMYDKKLPLAKGQFERAIPDLNFDTDPETYKEANYWLARVSQELGDSEKAIHHYGEVLVVDYDYKDARERSEKLQAG